MKFLIIFIISAQIIMSPFFTNKTLANDNKTIYYTAFENSNRRDTPTSLYQKDNFKLNNYERITYISLILASMYKFNLQYSNNSNSRLYTVLNFDIFGNSIFTAISAKSNNQPIFDRALLGGISGMTMFIGKEYISQNIDNNFCFIGKFIHAGGVSIRDNIIREEHPFEKYEFDLGPILFSYNFKTEDSKKFNLYLLPASMYSLFWNIDVGNSFDLNKTLKTGTLVFNGNIDEGFNKNAGISNTNIITLRRKLENLKENYLSTLVHESVHTLQYSEVGVFGYPIEKALKTKYEKIPEYVKFDRDIGSLLGFSLNMLSFDHDRYISELEPEIWEKKFSLY